MAGDKHRECLDWALNTGLAKHSFGFLHGERTFWPTEYFMGLFTPYVFFLIFKWSIVDIQCCVGFITAK